MADDQNFSWHRRIAFHVFLLADESTACRLVKAGDGEYILKAPKGVQTGKCAKPGEVLPSRRLLTPRHTK